MPCADCLTYYPEPFEVTDEEGEVCNAFWLMVETSRPIEIVGVEADGRLAYRFLIFDTLAHPEPGPGEEILCVECYCKRYPIANIEQIEEEPGNGQDDDLHSSGQ